MTSIQPLQQKSESRDDVRTEFERGLEEFIRGHLDECISFGSCSSVHNPEDGDEEGDQLVRRRRRSELEGDNLAESSAARRRQSQILSRWAARQAQEMITTIERRNRESELIALAGLQTVSMLDSSFLRESQTPTSRRQGTASAKLLIPKSRRRMVTFWTRVDENGDVADEFLEEGEKQINSEVLLLTSVDEFEFEKKRNRLERYDRNVTENTLMAIKKIDKIKSAREAKQEFWFLY